MNKTTISIPKILISLIVYFSLPLSAAWLNQFVDSMTITYMMIYSATALILISLNWEVFSLHLQRFAKNMKDCLLFTLICFIVIILLQLAYLGLLCLLRRQLHTGIQDLCRPHSSAGQRVDDHSDLRLSVRFSVHGQSASLDLRSVPAAVRLFLFDLDAGFLRLQSDPFDHPDDTGLLACSVRKHSSNFDLISFHLKSSGAPAVFL